MCAVPVEPEWRTDIMADGSPREILCKRLVEHAAATRLQLWWRLDALRWFATALLIYSVTGFAIRVFQYYEVL